jgi:3-hydroxyisobutyrate dehydrogenase-like beta-hydroxyacid dehydrogenase
MHAKAASPTVGIVATGAMGAAIAAVLTESGLRVVTTLEGRSNASRSRADNAGIEDVGGDAQLVAQSDIILSVVPPASAYQLAERIAAVGAPAHRLTFVDCNAIAPQTICQIQATLSAAGVAVIDGGIVGPPPRPDSRQPRIYVSGSDIEPAMRLKNFGLDVRPAGERIGDASALKLCYAALTKGTSGLFIELTAAASAYGVREVLEAEMLESQQALYERLADGMPAAFGKAHRFAGEMREMATAFGACGLPAAIFEGLGELYDVVAEARRSNSRLRETTYPDLSTSLARVFAPTQGPDSDNEKPTASAAG